MLTPNYYEGCADDIIELYEQLEDDIISDIVRRMMKTGVVTESAKHQAEILQNAGLLYDDILSEIAKRTDATEQQVKALFEDAGVETVKFDNEIYHQNGLTPVDIRQSPAMRQTLEAGYRKTLGNMKNLTLTTANTSQTTYINACNQAYMQVTSGAFSYQEAIKNAVQKTAQDGAFVLYPSGHRDRVDVAVRRSVLTGVGQTCREIGIMNAEEASCDLMEITAHSGARPEHAKWQGKLVSISGENAGRIIKGRKVLSKKQIGYGKGDGFGGWNCRHDWLPYFENFSVPNYSDKQLKQLDEKNIEYNGKKYSQYEISQIQRQYEREIRSAKREKVAFDTAVKETSDSELKAVMKSGSDYANQQIKEKQAKMRDFIQQTGNKRDYFREQNYGKNSYMQASEKNQQSQKNDENVLTSVLYSGNIKKDKSSNVNLEFYFDEHQEKYDEYLKSVPIKHQKALKYAADNCATYEINDDKIIYAYDGKLDTLLYNPQHKNFKFYDFNTTYTHELSHYLDKHFFKSFENVQFSKSISENSYSNQYISECLEKHNINIDKEMELSDIISALTLNKFNVKYGHETAYWEQNQKYHREKEIFVNLFNLEAQKNETIINFVQSSFPDVWDNYFKVCEKGLSNFIKEE